MTRKPPRYLSLWTPRWRYFFEMETDANGDHSLIALATRLAQVDPEARLCATGYLPEWLVLPPQVQFRLRQLSKADDRTRDLLLKDLERFAFDSNGAGPTEQSEAGGLSYDTAADSEKVGTCRGVR